MQKNQFNAQLVQNGLIGLNELWGIKVDRNKSSEPIGPKWIRANQIRLNRNKMVWNATNYIITKKIALNTISLKK